MHTDRIKNNFDIFNFNLTDKQMRKIDKDKFIKRLFPSPNKGK
jgi:diketogulonate reductase-like aldo/keto reductase